MKCYSSLTIATATILALPAAAYLPSVPKSIAHNTIDLDISSILAETEEALKVADEQLTNDRKVKTPSVTKKEKKIASPTTANDIDISDLMAEVELALNEAGANEEWDDISQLLADTEKITQSSSPASSQGFIHSWGSIVWDVTSSAMATLGKTAFSFTREQLKPDSDLSKFSRKAAKEANERARLLASSIDLVQMEKEGKGRLAKIQDMMNQNTQETKAKTSSSTASFTKYFADAMTSPFVKIWDNRASQTMQKVLKSVVTKENLVQRVTNRKFTPMPPSTPPPAVKTPKSYFFMQEKKSIRTSAKPAFVAGSNYIPAFVLADNVLQTWMRYTSTCVLLAFMLRSMAGNGAVAAAISHDLFESAHFVRVMKAIHSSQEEAQAANDEDSASIPYFACRG